MYAEEEKFIEQEIFNQFKQFMKWPNSLAVGVVTYDGEVLYTPLKSYAPKRYARHLTPFTKRVAHVAKCLDPLAEPLSYTVWTLHATYTVVIEEEFYTFGVQKALKLPTIPPKSLEEMSETERNEIKDKEIKMLRKIKMDKMKALAEAAAAPKEPETKKLKPKKKKLPRGVLKKPVMKKKIIAPKVTSTPKKIVKADAETKKVKGKKHREKKKGKSGKKGKKRKKDKSGKAKKERTEEEKKGDAKGKGEK